MSINPSATPTFSFNLPSIHHLEIDREIPILRESFVDFRPAQLLIKLFIALRREHKKSVSNLSKGDQAGEWAYRICFQLKRKSPPQVSAAAKESLQHPPADRRKLS